MDKNDSDFKGEYVIDPKNEATIFRITWRLRRLHPDQANIRVVNEPGIQDGKEE